LIDNQQEKILSFLLNAAFFALALCHIIITYSHMKKIILLALIGTLIAFGGCKKENVEEHIYTPPVNTYNVKYTFSATVGAKEFKLSYIDSAGTIHDSEMVSGGWTATFKAKTGAFLFLTITGSPAHQFSPSDYVKIEYDGITLNRGSVQPGSCLSAHGTLP
jgi:hypothetical protein